METTITAHEELNLIPRPTDYVAGVNSPIPFKVNIVSGDWTPYLPSGELQRYGSFESDSCISFSASNVIEAQLNYLKATKQLDTYTLMKCQDLGYIDPATGLFNFSDRFVAVMSGTTQQGNSVTKVWDTIRKFGMVAEKDWPFDASITTWAQYTAPIPQSVKDKALEFIKLFTINYEQVTGNYALHLQHAPLQMAIPVCHPWEVQGVIKACGKTQCEHGVMLYKDVFLSSRYILDQYNPFLKQLSADYPLPFVLKGIVSINPPQTVSAIQSIIAYLTAALKKVVTKT